jgi:hypothetical protein
MTWLKTVFLQDAAMLQDTYPENGMFRHDLFNNEGLRPVWDAYKAKVLAHVHSSNLIKASPTLKEFAEAVSSTLLYVFLRVDLHTGCCPLQYLFNGRFRTKIERWSYYESFE